MFRFLLIQTSPTICIQRQLPAIHNSHLGSCVNTVGDTVSMHVEPWFSQEVGKDFRKRENGGGKYYLMLGKGVNIKLFSFNTLSFKVCRFVDLHHL